MPVRPLAHLLTLLIVVTSASPQDASPPEDDGPATRPSTRQVSPPWSLWQEFTRPFLHHPGERFEGGGNFLCTAAFVKDRDGEEEEIAVVKLFDAHTDIYLVDLATGDLRRATDDKRYEVDLTTAGEAGIWFITGCEGEPWRVELLNADSLEKREVFSSEEQISELHPAGEGRVFIVAGRPGRRSILLATPDGMVTPFSAPEEDAYCPVIDLGGARVAYASPSRTRIGHQITVRSLDGRVVTKLEAPQSVVALAGWDTQGGIIYQANEPLDFGDGSPLWRIDIESGEAERFAGGTVEHVLPDGQKVAWERTIGAEAAVAELDGEPALAVIADQADFAYDIYLIGIGRDNYGKEARLTHSGGYKVGPFADSGGDRILFLQSQTTGPDRGHGDYVLIDLTTGETTTIADTERQN